MIQRWAASCRPIPSRGWTPTAIVGKNPEEEKSPLWSNHMQHSQRELSIPLVSSFNIPKSIARTYFWLMFQIVVSIALIVGAIALVNRSHMVITSPIWLFIFLSWVMIPGYGIWRQFKYLKILRRRQRTPAVGLRITQEGIYFSTWILWREIEAIFPYTVTFRDKDHTVLGIVPRDYQAISSRFVREHSSGVFIRLVMWGAGYWLLHEPRFLAPINITQEVLPLPVETLMEEIRTHFAAELEEYHIRCSF